MSPVGWSRRPLLQTVGTGIASAVGLSSRASAGETVAGDEIWRFEAGYEVESSPTVVDGTVYVGCHIEIEGERRLGGKLYAVDAETGEEEWHLETYYAIVSSPTVVDDTVYIGGGEGTLYALDANTGSQRWTVDTEYGIRSSPTIGGDLVCVGSGDIVYGIDAESGEKLWQFQTADSVRSSSPVVVAGTVYIGCLDGNLYAIDADTGEERWRTERGGRIGSSPTVTDETVYIGNLDTNYSLYAHEAATGDTLWWFDTGDTVRSTPTVHEETVYIGSHNGLFAVDAGTGDERWRFEVDSAMPSSPTFVDDTVVVGAVPNLYGVDAETGDERWRFETGDWIESSPTVVDGTVYVGSNDGNLYAIDAGVNGSSEGSRVMLGTLGHHSSWQGVGEVPVVTRDATAIDHTVATLNGELVEVADGESVSVYFEWGEVDDGFTNQTVTQVRDSTGAFDAAITDLDPGTEYHFRAVATVDGRVARASSHSFTTDEGCFIATAACGTPDHEHVELLRSFRDRTLKGTRAGDLLIETYYSTSPPVAAWIERGRYRQLLVRTAVVRPAATAVELARRVVSRF